jgi:chorismate mutase/prephenate dehydratase
MTIKDLRKKIDAIDRKIVELINRRTSHVLQIGKIKRVGRKGIYAPEREKEIYGRIASLCKGPLPVNSLKAIYREIMSAAMALEKEIVIAYLGPEATFTHMAARRKFGASVRYAAADSIADIFLEVERGHADYGVVPIENSIEGAVTHTLDMFIDSKAKICAEIFLDVSQCLLANCRPDSVKKIYSKLEVFGQCRIWLRNNYPKAELIGVSSTARAAELAAKERETAALASDLAAEIYGLKILQRAVEDSGKNETRFLIIGERSTGKSGDDKTSIIVSVADRVGALYKMLYPFKRHGINLTKIESRPSKKKAWEYYFFVDFVGHIDDENVVEALRDLGKHALFIKHLGSYPRAK